MRLRNVRGSREKIAESIFTVQQPELQKGRWRQFFKNSSPIHIEIGMGKGKFLFELAKSNPDINYIGIEKYSSVLIRAIEKREQYEGDNLMFIRMDAETITEIFEQHEVDKIYLNFSDPWPKDRHAKRRLTSKQFLTRYDSILALDGEVVFKTDNEELFSFSLEQAAEAGWKLMKLTHDLHKSEYAAGNVMTEYEEKFSAEGKPIHMLTAVR